MAELLKGIVKILVLGAVLTALMWPDRGRIMALVRTDPVTMLPLARSLALKLMGTVVAILAVLGAADYSNTGVGMKSKKKSLRDIKEEFKQSEGDPAIKGKLKQMRQSRAHANDDAGT